ncbi:DUF4910 domain-containing protein [Psychrobacter sp. 1U2]|uniref:DUF4910 domain-containing protein n=1 Tax=Psychrobacter sp. 1U2 TaxID=3453577 RepID=UPI003F45F874
MEAVIDTGISMHGLCKKLFPICRSITGNGFRKSLAIIKNDVQLDDLQFFEVATGTQCFDWEVPKEWNIRDAYIITPDGNKICDFKASNLHVVGYSMPVDQEISLEMLQNHLYSLPNQPDAIPYITSYYQERWGFCLTEQQREALKPGIYQVYIDSELTAGSLTYGELIIAGDTEQEVLLSSYLCHPSMANNELSGPVVTAFLAKWLLSLPSRRYTYRIIIIPETIGSITYLSRHYQTMKKNIIAGFNITCVGDDRAYSYLSSRTGDTLADQAAKHVLAHTHPDYVSYSFLDRGSDERQYCSSGIDLPVCSIMRSKYGCYPEYHTSLDDLELVTASGLLGSYRVLKKAIQCLEANETLTTTVLGEPQLGKRGLYPTIGTKEGGAKVQNMMDFLAYCDGVSSNLEIADKIKLPLWELDDIINQLKAEQLLKSVH